MGSSAWALRAGGAAGVALGVALQIGIGTFFVLLQKDASPVVALLVLVASWGAGLGVMWLGLRAQQRARRMTLPTATALLSRDRRPPVLYLRSFGDDARTRRAYAPTLTRINFHTEEEQLAAALSPLGPFVAVGRPGEELPELGAARLYFKDEDWQREVGRLLSEARLVLLRGGESAGLLWEMKEVIGHVPPERLVLIMGAQKEFEHFVKHVEKLLPCKLEGFSHDKRLGTLGGFIAFGPEWRPIALKSHSPWIRSTMLWPYRAAITFSLQPLFDQFKIRWKKPPIAASKVSGLILTALLVTVTLRHQSGHTLQELLNRAIDGLGLLH